MKSLDLVSDLRNGPLHGLVSYIDYDGRLVHRKVKDKPNRKFKENHARDGFEDGTYATGDEAATIALVLRSAQSRFGQSRSATK